MPNPSECCAIKSSQSVEIEGLTFANYLKFVALLNPTLV